MRMLWYLWFCYKAYCSTGDKLTYSALCWRGVPWIAVVIARDREAWRVSQFAIEALRTKC